MDVVDLLASQQTWNKSYEFVGPPYPPFDELPLIGYDGVDPNWPPLLEMIYNVTPAIAGDANADGAVDLQDFGILKANFGGAGGWYDGDFNGDGNVDLQDFGLLKANFGTGGATAVPEPASAMLMACGLVMLARRARGRK